MLVGPGKAAIRMTHTELLGLIALANKTPGDYHELCMLPRDPKSPVTAANTFIATKTQRKFLVALYQMKHDVGQYKQEVQSLSGSHHQAP